MSDRTLPRQRPTRNDASDRPAPQLPLMVGTTRAAELLGLHPCVVREEIHAGRLQARRYGRKFLIPRESLEAFAAGLPEVNE